ncbi:MAG: DUF3793 family protein [Acutalibacter sp.]
MKGGALERSLIEHGAPTLAGLKTASLFCVPAQGDWQAQVDQWDRFLRGKGLTLRMLRRQGERVLLYLYRPAQLQRDLHRPGVLGFLTQYGYRASSVEEVVERLRQRLEESTGFPHEVGLFLGYPLEDVVGFIRHGGKNCKCSGCWKVYSNELEARKRFAKLDKCRRIYAKLYSQGRTVRQMTVAA